MPSGPSVHMEYIEGTDAIDRSCPSCDPIYTLAVNHLYRQIDGIAESRGQRVDELEIVYLPGYGDNTWHICAVYRLI